MEGAEPCVKGSGVSLAVEPPTWCLSIGSGPSESVCRAAADHLSCVTDKGIHPPVRLSVFLRSHTSARHLRVTWPPDQSRPQHHKSLKPNWTASEINNLPSVSCNFFPNVVSRHKLAFGFWGRINIKSMCFYFVLLSEIFQQLSVETKPVCVSLQISLITWYVEWFYSWSGSSAWSLLLFFFLFKASCCQRSSCLNSCWYTLSGHTYIKTCGWALMRWYSP